MNKQATKYHNRQKNVGWTPMQGPSPCFRTNSELVVIVIAIYIYIYYVEMQCK